MSRRAFNQAAEFFIQSVSRISDGDWDSPGLGEWTIRDLVGHTSRTLVTLETYAAQPGLSADLDGPVGYFLAVRGSLADPASVAQRGRDAGQQLGERPVAWVQAAAQRVSALLDDLPDDAILTTPVSGIRLTDYLPTRIFELTIHSLDLGRAINVKVEPPPEPLLVTLRLLADLAVATGSGPDLA